MLVGYKQVMMKTTSNIPSMNHKILNLQYLNNNFGQTLRHFGSTSSGNNHGTGTRGRGRKLNKFGRDYNKIGGPIDTSICGLSETEINNLIN